MPQRMPEPARPPGEAPVRRLPVQHEPGTPTRSPRDDRRAIRTAVRARRRAEAGERRSARPRRRRLAAGAVAGVLVLLVGVPLVLAFGPVFPVRTISVSGASAPVTAAVRNALAGQLGRPVALVDEQQVAAALEAVPAVERFTLVRRPPSTIELVVVPRTVVAQERTADGWAQVDAAHVVVSVRPTQGVLPVITLAETAQRPERTYAAAVSALAALEGTTPAPTGVRATSPDDVVVTLTGGIDVRWGGAEDGAAKAEALHAALRRAAAGATTIDVSSPGVVLTR